MAALTVLPFFLPKPSIIQIQTFWKTKIKPIWFGIK
jgi:hypothetical protein